VIGFCRHFGLPERLAPSPTILAYLAARWRWRLVGVTAALVLELLLSSSEHLLVTFDVLIGGLLAGAVVGEVVFRMRTTPSPGPRHRTPRLLTAVLTGVLVLAVGTSIGLGFLVTAEPAGMRSWGGVTVVVVLTTEVVVRVLASGRLSRGTPEEATAIARSGIHFVAAGGVALALLCLVRALDLAGGRLAGRTGAALVTVSLLWALTAYALAIVLVRAGWRRTNPATWLNPRVQVAVVSSLVLAISAGAVGVGVWRDRPPYPASAVNPRVTLVISDWEHHAPVAALLGTTGEQPELTTTGSEVAIYGRLDLDPAPNSSADDYYHLVLIDLATNATLRNIYTAEGNSWGSMMNLVARKYPWLSAFAAVDGSALVAPAARPGPLVFTALFPRPIQPTQLRAVLVLFRAEDQVFWAVDVPISSLPAPS
jgi:hypothetical protein